MESNLDELSHAELLKHAAKIELTNDFVDFCIKYGMFNSQAIRQLEAVEMSEHDLFYPTGFDTAAQHDALRWLSVLHYGAKKWTAYLLDKSIGYGPEQEDLITEFLRSWEPE